MEGTNPTALTWIFSHPVSDPEHIEPESLLIKELCDYPWFQYLAYHVVQHSKTKNIYIRGILRCFQPRSYLQIKSIVVDASPKPLRGMFTPLVVKDKLRPTNRIGSLIEVGTLTLQNKRPIECSGTCRHCCTSNKRSQPGGSSSP